MRFVVEKCGSERGVLSFEQRDSEWLSDRGYCQGNSARALVLRIDELGGVRQ